MGTTTPNLGLYKPNEAENGWAALVNANFDTLDSALTPPTGPVYAVTPDEEQRGFDAASATLNDLANTLATLIGDLQAAGLLS